MGAKLLGFFLGGASGKRQAGWVVFIIVNAFLAWVIKTHAGGTDMGAFVGMFTIAWPMSFIAAIAPHTIHHFTALDKSPKWEE